MNNESAMQRLFQDVSKKMNQQWDYAAQVRSRTEAMDLLKLCDYEKFKELYFQINYYEHGMGD